MHTQQLLQKFPLITDQVDKKELDVLLSELERLLIDGRTEAIVEFGCYQGTSSLFIQRLINSYGLDNAYHVYDSFEGLPEKLPQDASPAGLQFTRGELKTSKRVFIDNFRRSNLNLPVIHKTWFEELTADQVPASICFAFLDGDYYQSVLTPLRLIDEKMIDGGSIVVDDYQSEALPGAKKAVDQWIKEKGYALSVAHSLAVIRIP